MDKTLVDGVFTPVTGMEGNKYIITLSTNFNSTILDTATVSVSSMTQEQIEAATLTITVNSAYSQEVEQGGLVVFNTSRSGLTSNYVEWFLEGNDSPNTRVGTYSYSSQYRGGLWVSSDETIGNTLRVTAVSTVSDQVVSNTIEIKVLPIEEGKTVIEIPGAIGSGVVGGEGTIIIDDVEFYILTIKDSNNDGVNDQALLWSANAVSLPKEVTVTTDYTNGGDRTYFHNRTTGSTLWGESYMRNEVLTAWVSEFATIKNKAIPTELVTDGYYTNATNTSTGARADEGTTDSIFILSQPEFLDYVGRSDPRGAATSNYLRSASSEIYIKHVGDAGGSIYGNQSSTSAGASVRPAFWISL